MSIKQTVEKYTSNSEPFVKLLHRHARGFPSKFRQSVVINDYESRHIVKSWARNISDINHAEPDLRILIEDVVGDLVNRLVEHGEIFSLDPASRQKPPPKRPNMASFVRNYLNEYLSIQTGLSIVQEMLGQNLANPNPDQILNAAVIVRNIPGRAKLFASLLGLTPIIEAIMDGGDP